MRLAVFCRAFPFCSAVSRAFIQVLACLLILPATASAQAPAQTESELRVDPPVEFFAGERIATIRVEGILRTQEAVVLRELLFLSGDKVDPVRIEESLRRLKNLRIFRTASVRLVPRAEGGVDAVVKVEEKWTIIPVTRVGGSVGSAHFVLGVYDLNLAGRYLELGSQYENYNGVHGGAAWFRDPRLFDERQRLSLEIGLLGRPRALYEGNEARLVGAYVQRRDRVFAAVDREMDPFLTLGLGAELSRNRFGTRGLSSDQLRANTDNVFTGPAPASTALVELRLFLGRLNLEDYLIEGALLEAHVQQAISMQGAGTPFHKGTLQGSLFGILPWRQNVGVRTGLGTTDARAIPDGFFVGGLEQVRGYVDGEFHGRRSWYFNAEYRLPSLRSRFLVVQHVGFFDTGNAANSWAILDPLASNTPRSVGTGLRFIVPLVARFNVRVDYAFTLSRRRARGIVFGMQQFF